MHRVWYEGAVSGWVLWPLSGIYWLLLKLRALLFRCGVYRSFKAHAPVVVVGNITAGGTGKTPTVIWLVNELRGKGFTPGIVSRGYGGSKSGTSMRVDARSDPAVVGDEPVLLAQRGQCPVAVDSDRVQAAAMLVDDGVDVIISDDGLQHLRLRRDFEICVIDGERGLGNRRLLPAGPLRESPNRLASVDQVLVNGSTDMPNAISFELQATDACRLNGSLARPLQRFKDTTVHAVAGIGNPKRFFDLLRGFGIQVIEHSFPDHAVITQAELKFGDDFEVFMTEKDAVKLGRKLIDRYWFVPVDLIMDATKSSALIEQIAVLLKKCGEQ
jgi:tetraacyldisaccharide 4'-kinase